MAGKCAGAESVLWFARSRPYEKNPSMEIISTEILLLGERAVTPDAVVLA